MSDIFEADELEAAAVTAEPEVVEAPAPEVARDEAGRFAPKADEPVAEPEPQAEQEQQRQVPQGALHAEREKHKGTKAQLGQAQQQLQALAQLRQQIASRKLEPLPIAADEDPASGTAYLRGQIEQLRGSQASMEQRDQLSQVESAERQQLGSLLTQSEAEYRTVKPDYDAAINHVVNARAQELALYGLAPHEVQEALQQEVLDITRSAIQQGRAPAEVAYQLATLRGYRPEAGPAPTPQPGQAQRTVEAVGAARASSRSLGQASGTGSTRDLDANTITAMSPEEFDALYSTPEGRRLIDAL